MKSGCHARTVASLVRRLATWFFCIGLSAHASAEPIPEAPGAELNSQVALDALTLLGVNYRYGGSTPESGLDCSGLVRHVFFNALGMQLPRRSLEISRLGGKVGRTDLQPGDLVFFNTLRRAFSHVGIYIGQRRFVHAPSSGGGIRVENLDADYWVRHFNGARRLLPAGKYAGPGKPSFVGGRVDPAWMQVQSDIRDAAGTTEDRSQRSSDSVNPL